METAGRRNGRRRKLSGEPHPDAEHILGGALYRVDDVARVLGVAPGTVRDLISNGDLTASLIGGAYRITTQAIRAFVQERDRQAAVVADGKRRERDRKRELVRKQGLDPAAKWDEAMCVWCGVTPVIRTRHDRLDGDVRCEACDDLARRDARPEEPLSVSKDVCERTITLQVRELDRQAEENLGLYERAERDHVIERKIRQAEKVPLILAERDDHRRALVARASARPPHWMIFRCPLCGRPQSVSRKDLKNPHVYPLCKHEAPYELSSANARDLMLRQWECQQQEWAGAPMPAGTISELYRDPRIIVAFAEMEAWERNREEGYEPDPELDEQRWKVCLCAHCGERQAVAPPESRLIGHTTCRTCVYRGKPISTAERVKVIAGELSPRHQGITFRMSTCACGGRELSSHEGDQQVMLSWCRRRSERERIKLALAWVERYSIPKSVASTLCADVQDDPKLEDLPF